PAPEIAAIGVVAAVGERRQELMYQVAMRGVHLDQVVAGGERALRRLAPAGDHPCDLAPIESVGAGPVLAGGRRAGRDRLPWRVPVPAVLRRERAVSFPRRAPRPLASAV